MNSTIDYDVVIAGAGPAGTACALELRKHHLKVALIDAQSFPRDKVCGDAIPHRAVKTIKQIAPELYEQLKNEPALMPSNGCRIVSPSGKEIEIRFSLEGYISKRLDFDNLLLQYLLKTKTVDFYEEEKIISVKSSGEKIDVITNKRTLSSKLIIGCDGAHSEVRKNMLGKSIDAEHYCGAVRGYFQGIENVKEGIMEIHLFRQLPYAYFWIFPLPGGWANVGLGMLSKKIAEQKINLRKAMHELISGNSTLALRLKNTVMHGEITGFGLPLGSLRSKLSGNRFMLCGDAGSLIDPATGEGIGNAMLSGMLAAQQAVKCFEKNDFREEFLNGYDNEVYSRLGDEFKSKYRLQQLIGSKPFLADWAISAAQKFPWLKKQMQKLF